ncbi:helix-turn-helix domain-containing protein [Pseudoclavibacter sp. CFCC 14310]|uniref:helix-turn-helix domain-containing protein n=1 Tax=Pseudoclavibacter sp. CFCC 14310 TaxID=2615180 RepID=UPI00178800DD|nr:helix-turn-helix domain-containing protein [Pseudoclavibacter sp. CFCC 14310]
MSYASNSSAANLRWREMISQLHDNVEYLVADFIDEMNRLSVYELQQPNHSDLVETAFSSYRSILAAVLALDPEKHPSWEHMEHIASELGRTRARAGISVNALVQAIQIDFRIIWDRLLAMSDEQDLAVLATHVKDLWHAVDSYARYAQTSYHVERNLILREDQDQRALMLSRFLSKTSPDTVLTNSLGVAFGLDPTATYEVCAGINDPAIGRVRLRAQTYSRRVVFHAEPTQIWVMFWPADIPDSPAHPLRALADLSCGHVGRVAGLSQIPAASRAAAEIARVLEPTDVGPYTVQDVWTRFAARTLRHRAPQAFISFDRAFEGCSPRERGQLMQTVRTFLLSGSAAEAAATLGCHRNTVLNRLHRLIDLTGLDLTTPRDAAYVHVLLADTSSTTRT